MMKKIFTLLPVLALFAAACSETATAPERMEPEVTALFATLPNSVEWDGQGSDALRCDKLGESPERTEAGWMHWIITQGSGVTEAELVLGGSGSGTYEPTKYGPVVEFFSPYFDVETLTATLHYAGTLGDNSQFTLSDYCPADGPSLDVRKTAFAEFDREHFWDIAKKVETENQYTVDEDVAKIWLYIDGNGDEEATWTVDVTYEGYEDSGFVVYGTIEIENISSSEADKVITSITDNLGFGEYDDIEIDCGEDFELPYTIEYGEVLTCTYRVDLDPDSDGVKAGDSGTNEVSVVVDGESDPYTATDDWEFDQPETETNATVSIKDISDLFGEEDLGTVTAPNGDEFTYTKDFAFADYGADDCGSFAYDNTATIVETEQSADATLKVNVQCFVYESAWAMGEGGGVDAKPFCDNGFNNWGWTNEIAKPYEGSWPLYAGAAQCDPARGTLVGHFHIFYNGGFDFEFVPEDGIPFEGEAVYADADMFPRLPGRFGGPTTAPGQYYVASDLDGNIHVIAHVNVGMPDPDFGPAEN